MTSMTNRTAALAYHLAHTMHAVRDLATDALKTQCPRSPPRMRSATPSITLKCCELGCAVCGMGCSAHVGGSAGGAAGSTSASGATGGGRSSMCLKATTLAGALNLLERVDLATLITCWQGQLCRKSGLWTSQ